MAGSSEISRRNRRRCRDINIRNERNFTFTKFARGAWISGKRWWKFNRDTRILDIGAEERRRSVPRAPPLEITPWPSQFLQELQIVRKHPDLTFPPLSLSLSSPSRRLSITVIFVINLSRCKNVLLRNPVDLVPAPISCVPGASIDLARRFEGERGRYRSPGIHSDAVYRAWRWRYFR